MSDLAKKRCIPCEGDVEPLGEEVVGEYLTQVKGWAAAPDNKSIFKEYKFKDFVEGVVFITDVAHVAEEEGHHPALHLHHYKFVTVTIMTDAIQGLSENDFILAAKIDEMQKSSDRN